MSSQSCLLANATNLALLGPAGHVDVGSKTSASLRKYQGCKAVHGSNPASPFSNTHLYGAGMVNLFPLHMVFTASFSLGGFRFHSLEMRVTPAW